MPWIRFLCVVGIVIILGRQGISIKNWTFFELMGLICLISILSYEEGLGPKEKYKLLPIIDVSTCDGCRKCIDVCDIKGLTLQNNLAVFHKPYECISDGACMKACPLGAIKMQPVLITI